MAANRRAQLYYTALDSKIPEGNEIIDRLSVPQSAKSGMIIFFAG